MKDNQDDQMYLRMADILAEKSKCISHKIACLIVNDGRIIAAGYNGTPAGYQNCCDRYIGKLTEGTWDRKEHHEWSLKYETHAEMNAILFAARKGISIEGSTLYSTTQPCWQCTKNLAASGITRIVFSRPYDAMAWYSTSDTEVNEFLMTMGIEYYHVPIESDE